MIAQNGNKSKVLYPLYIIHYKTTYTSGFYQIGYSLKCIYCVLLDSCVILHLSFSLINNCNVTNLCIHYHSIHNVARSGL